MDNPIIAVIDIGSNSIRLQISKILDRTYKVIEEYKETVRIGDNVYRTGAFSPDAIEIIKAALTRMRTMMDSNKVQRYRAVATASFREASNAEEVVKIIKDATDINIEIISGIEEARLMYLAASAYFQLNEGNTLLIDMGGGSTEFSYAAYGELKFSESTPLGCSKLTYQFLKSDPVKRDDVKKLRNHLAEATNDFLPLYGVDRLVCSGGTLNNLALIYNKRHNLSDLGVKFVDSIFTKHFANEITGKSLAERAKIPGLELARADIILPATILVQMIMKRYKLEGFYTLSGGLRTGLTIDLINKTGISMLFQCEDHVDIRYSRLIETGKKYYFEEDHALQVTKLAEKVFENLRTMLNLTPADWLILEAAAILHDVGQYISYSRHHKHSYYLITNSELTGYSEKDTELIANVARYHRRSIPKSSHTHFSRLSQNDRERVTKLAAILRVADGLDRSHSNFINDIKIDVKADTIVFSAITDNDISMEENGFDKKKDLLQILTGKDVVLI